jgi:hypothetical protein
MTCAKQSTVISVDISTIGLLSTHNKFRTYNLDMIQEMKATFALLNAKLQVLAVRVNV